MCQVLGQAFNPTQPAPQQGWECPKCRRVYSPTTQMCLFCPVSYTTTTTITGGDGAGAAGGGGNSDWNVRYYGDGTTPYKYTQNSYTFISKNEIDPETRCSTCGLTRSMSGYTNCPEGFHFSK